MSDVHREGASPPVMWRNPRVLSSVASGILLVAGWLAEGSGLPRTVWLAIYFAGLVSGGYFFMREALEELIGERRIDTEMLMSVAAVTAFAMGAPAEGVMLVFLFSISEAAEAYTEDKTRAAVRALMQLEPRTALVRRNGREEVIAAEDLVVGDVFITRPGQAIATDGEVVNGWANVNQSPVTGESLPVAKSAGASVFAGTICSDGVLEVRATKTYADNTIARIIAMVEEAQERKGKSERFIDRFGARYSPAVLAVGIALAILPPLLGQPWGVWLTRATVFIVAAAPCALVISVPVTLAAALGTAARTGVLIKGGVYLEELAQVRVVALDKTGTLTSGELAVTEVVPCDGPGGLSRSELLAVAAGVERHSEHPLARAIVRHALASGVEPRRVDGFRALAGEGATAWLDGQELTVGSPDAFGTGLAAGCSPEQIRELQDQGQTVVLVGSGGAAWGALALRDSLRPNAAAAVQALRQAGIAHIFMLTGDNERAAQRIAQQTGITDVRAGLKPEDKVAQVRELAERYGRVAMLGDGVNDAPALAAATVGVTLGAAGTDVALETADVALMGDDLERLAHAVRLARRSETIVRQNVALSILVVGSLVVGALFGWFTLPAAIIGHEVSEWLVIANGLRMLRA